MISRLLSYRAIYTSTGPTCEPVLKNKGINKKAQKRYTSPICPEAPSGWICNKFGLGGPLADIINCAEFCGSRLRGCDSVEGTGVEFF